MPISSDARTASRFLTIRRGRPLQYSWRRAMSASSSFAWAVLVVAGLFEIGWAVGMKYADGFTRPIPSLITLACMIVSVVALGIALRTLPLGTAYALWTGIGTIGTALFGIALLGEAADPVRLFCIGLIVAGIAGLKLASP